MQIDELYGLLPENRREEGKACIAEMSKGYVKIDGPDIAAKVMGENPYLKSILESETSKRVANHDAKFMSEKFPGLVEEEIKKRGPKPKDPEVAALAEKLAEVEKREAEAKAREVRATQKAKAVSFLASKKLPETLADDYIGATDEETDAKLARLASTLDPWVKAQVDAMVAGRIGNQGTPPAGEPPKPADLQAQYAAAEKAQNGPEMLRLKGLMQRAANT